MNSHKNIVAEFQNKYGETKRIRSTRNGLRASLTTLGKTKNLGYFKTKELAAKFLSGERAKLHGEFANNGTFI